MEQTASTSMSILPGLVSLALFFVIIWFIMIRPEKKRREKHEAMLNNLKPGDNVITIGGIKGKVIKIKDDNIRLRVSSNVDIDVVKNSIGNVIIPEGSEETKETKKVEEAKEEKTESEE